MRVEHGAVYIDRVYIYIFIRAQTADTALDLLGLGRVANATNKPTTKGQCA